MSLPESDFDSPNVGYVVLLSGVGWQGGKNYLRFHGLRVDELLDW